MKLALRLRFVDAAPMPSPAACRLSLLRAAGLLLCSTAAGAALHYALQVTAPSSTPAPARAVAATAATPSAAPGAAPVPTRESLAALPPQEQIAAIAAALPHMELADLLPLVEHLLKARAIAAASEAPAAPFGAEPPDLISPLLRALFTRWATLDAAGLMAYVESGPLRYDYDTRRLAVLALVEVRGLSALEEVRAKSPSIAYEAATEMLIRQPEQLEALLPFLKGGPVQEIDPFAATEEDPQIATALGPFRYLLYRLELGLPAGDALNQLNTALSPDAVLQALHALPPGPRRDSVLSAWLLSKVPHGDALSDKESDYTFFRREYEAMAEGPAKSALNSRYATLRAFENPDAALKWAQNLPDARQRFDAITTICASLFIGTDAGNTFLGFYGREGDAAERLTRQFADAWLAAPEAPIARYLGASSYALNPFREWHIKDPAASEAWLATVPNPELRKLLAESASLRAAALLKFMTDSSTRLDHASRELFGPTAFDPSHADEIAAIPAEWREAARLQHLEQTRLSTSEWEGLKPEERYHIGASVIRRAAEAPNKEIALDIFHSLSPEERSLGAYYEAGAAYIKSDEAAASQWLDSLPPGAERDAAATALVEHLVKPGDSQDGEAAFAWAAAMSGETERTRYAAEAIRAWAATDAAAARAAVEASALPSAEKSALLRQFPAEGGAR